jgi:hypothetical protein
MPLRIRNWYSIVPDLMPICLDNGGKHVIVEWTPNEAHEHRPKTAGGKIGWYSFEYGCARRFGLVMRGVSSTLQEETYKNMQQRITLWVIVVLMIGRVSEAGLFQEGFLFGDNHAFYFTAPPGWVLDNHSGVNEGLYMVFYPAGQTWTESPVIAYARSLTKDDLITSIPDQVQMTVTTFRAQGSPQYQAEQQASQTLANGQQVAIYYFTGDQWGNYEAVGYIEEESTINFLVLNAKNKPIFEVSLPAFSALLSSYENVYNRSAHEIDEAMFAQLRQEADQAVSTDEGKAYETAMMKQAGQSLATFLKDCTDYTKTQPLHNIDLFVRISPQGEVSDILVRPNTSLSVCLRGLLLHTHHPPHQFPSFLEYMDIRIQE